MTKWLKTLDKTLALRRYGFNKHSKYCPDTAMPKQLAIAKLTSNRPPARSPWRCRLLAIGAAAEPTTNIATYPNKCGFCLA